MNNVDNAVDQLIAIIRDSETYREYTTQLERVKGCPGLKEQIDEFRARNYVLQTGGEVDFDKLDEFERSYEDFRDRPEVSDFLAAELALCRLMQDISIRIIDAVSFE